MTDLENPARHPDLPPEYEAYIGPEESLPNAFGAVGDFFGGPFRPDMIDMVETLPAEQAATLLSRITYVTERASNAIGARNSSGFPTEDTFGVLALEGIHLMSSSNVEPSQPVPELPGLKQAALYCARTIIPDTLSGEIVDDNPGRELAHRLRQIEPIAGLIQAGVFIPVSKLPDDGKRLLTSLMRFDPYVAHLLRKNPNAELRIRTEVENALYDPSWYTDSVDPVTQAIQRCATILSKIYPEKISSEKLAETLLYCSQARMGNFTPIASDLKATRHLLQCNAAAIEGDESSYSRVMRQAESPFSPAVTFRMPALSEISFEQILVLRRNEEVFAKVSAALGALSRACAGQTQNVESYQDYIDLVRQHSEETIRPVHDELSRWHDRAAKRQRIAGVSAEIINLGLDIVSVPGLSKLGGAAARKLMTGKRTGQTREDTEVGARILKTFL